MAAGDTNGDGHDDLAIGVPREDLDGISNQGAFARLYGSGSGLASAGNGLYRQADGEAESGDAFAWSLTMGNFDGDPNTEVVAGAPFETLCPPQGPPCAGGAGSIHLVFVTNYIEGWHQDSPGILDLAELNDHFGWAVAVGDFDGNGGDDLAVGVPDEDLGAITDAGAVNVIYSDKPPAATNTPTRTPTATPALDTPTPTATTGQPTNTPTPAALTNTPPPGATSTPTPPAGSLIGDVDCSGNVNAIDAAFLLQLVAQLISSVPCPQHADVNADGASNTIDAALILQFGAGMIDTLPP